jgi:pSer/pThr/pTyr-binding forkhead associated (FHA) protein
MSIELTWYLANEPGGNARHRETLDGPGPFTIGRANNCDVILPDTGASRLHARISLRGAEIEISDADSSNGTRIDGQEISTAIWPSGSQVQIGDHIIEARRLDGDGARTSVSQAPVDGAFPPAEFNQQIVPVKALEAKGLIAGQIDYLALGGGLGSFIWIDHLRNYGVALEKIRSIGVDASPYGKYERLCRFSQIPRYERLRSNSASTPDNIWGFPGYASRETWRDLRKGKLSGLKYILQVFGEPTLQESYTPQAGDVFESIDHEAKRIGWDKIWTAGRIIKIRKTDDGRYAVAFRVPADHVTSGQRNKVMIATHLHLSMGYPASRYLDDLQEFKRTNPRSRRVINAYEQHDEIYQDLEKSGGIVLVRGRGIVASRILQRLYEARKNNPDIRVLHIMRSRIVEGKTYDLAQRLATHDIEYQPFNWPKACWSGTLREVLEKASPEERTKLLSTWGGTTTADRADWDAIITDGKREGWYRPFFGNVERITLDGDKITSRLESSEGFNEEVNLAADYVIDCTGLIADLDANPVLRDLVDTYSIRRNKVSGNGPEQRLSGLYVSNGFEVEDMRNGTGRVYAAGVTTLNGPYAAVDSFLGLQYSALRSVDELGAQKAPGITKMGPIRSVAKWWRWCRNAAP